MKPQHLHVEHTAEFSNRRRALFPSDENSTDSDLGCISPLDFDTDHDNGCLDNEKVFSLNKCVGDYDIIGLVNKSNTINTPKNDPLPCITQKINTPVTCLDESPTQQLKTPHDISNNTKLPKLIRKTFQDTLIPEQNYDNNKNSKVRTALFPEIDMPLPPKTFYPKSENETSPRSFIRNRKATPKKSNNKRQNLYLCNRRSRYRSGQINAGVKHKIKKSKKVHKINKNAMIQAAINIIENSPLNAVLNNSDKETDVEQQPLPPSPSPSPEPDPTRKFFKTLRPKGIITVNENIKFEVNKGKMSLITNKNGVKRPKAPQEVNAKRLKLTDNEFNNEKDTLLPSNQISNIIENLEEDNKENNGEKPIILMSPTSQMCNMTSGLAINSPKKAKNLNNILEAMPSRTEQKKLFPLFYPGKVTFPSPSHKTEVSKSNAKKFKPISKDQMLLDAGQKKWGATQCPECKIIYHMGDPGDEIMHLNYHNAEHIFRFNGWKNERVVSNLLDAKIIQILPNDSKVWWKKVKDVMDVVNRDLGFYDIEFNATNSQIFFYIKSRVIAGVLVAEVKTTAHKLLTTQYDQVDLCSEESYPIKCGVSRVWVSQHNRKKGIATCLMNCLKRNFMFGNVLKNEDIAFSSPTEMGKIFGRSYFKTPNFLIYFV